jgi:RNA recognition motif-containing protein
LAPRRPGAFIPARAPSQKPPELPARAPTRGGEHFHFSLEILLMTKLYVGNLPFSITEDAIRNLFTPHGAVEKISLISDRETGRPRGFGFVEMSNADASRAMQALNGKEVDGRALKINEAQDKPRTGGYRN